MVEAAMLWNEPNNLSHWDFELDPEWDIFARMIDCASAAISAEAPRLPKVLGEISPIDPAFLQRLQARQVLDNVDAVAVHGFPLDWNHWNVNEWPNKLDEIRAVTDKPIWVSEVGASSVGSIRIGIVSIALSHDACVPNTKQPRPVELTSEENDVQERT